MITAVVNFMESISRFVDLCKGILTSFKIDCFHGSGSTRNKTPEPNKLNFLSSHSTVQNIDTKEKLTSPSQREFA